MELTDFQKSFMAQLQMEAQENQWPVLFKKAPPKKETDTPMASDYIAYFIQEQRFTFIVADYTIDHNFTLSFQSDETYLRFGIVYKGTSRFNLANTERTTFYPSPYLTYEDSLQGIQHWEKGQHYQALEFFIEPQYLDTIAKIYPEEIHRLKSLIPNHVYLSLPQDTLDVLTELKHHYDRKTLNPMTLESFVLRCLSAISHSTQSEKTYERVPLGLKRLLKLSKRDLSAINRAKELIDNSLPHPPTVQALSTLLDISEQKLTYGFKSVYQETIGTYIKNYRLLTACNLLGNSELSIRDIAHSTGYSCSPNFCNAFKLKFKQSPKDYRRSSQSLGHCQQP